MFWDNYEPELFSLLIYKIWNKYIGSSYIHYLIIDHIDELDEKMVSPNNIC